MASLLPITNQKTVKTDGIYKRFQRLKQPGNPLICHLIVTPVPNFLFSEQTLKMLPQGGACAMFSTSKYKFPIAVRPVETGDRMITRHDF
jgi:hypothetical protein